MAKEGTTNDPEGISSTIPKLSVIVIDDDPLVLRTVHEYLKYDYDVHIARSGTGAYHYLDRNHVDLILIDFEMPGEKGDSVLRNIREIPTAAAAPAIFLTGVADPHTVAEILLSHPQGYLLKPVSKEKLIEKIHEVLNAQG